jgi:thymidylate synthase (FAD)
LAESGGNLVTNRRQRGNAQLNTQANTRAGLKSDASASPEGLVRPNVPALDAILGQPFQVLDKGFVRVVDYMGNDTAIVQAARVSYGIGTKRMHEDRGLIRYLMRHWHTTPFEMCEIKLHVRVPMDTWRQWIRHRTANVNEYSTRYSVAIDAAQRTAPDQWRSQATSNRQGSAGYLQTSIGKRLTSQEQQLQKKAREIYEARIAAGVAREQARKDLPLATFTEAYWKIDLHNLLHFLYLRMDTLAQQEIREYATVIGEKIVAKWVPLVWEAFLDYQRNAVQLSRVEAGIIAALAANAPERARELAAADGLLDPGKSGGLAPNLERMEIETKLRAFGLTPPWA